MDPVKLPQAKNALFVDDQAVSWRYRRNPGTGSVTWAPRQDGGRGDTLGCWATHRRVCTVLTVKSIVERKGGGVGRV